jgi:Tfp pilus assembly protein PilO
MKLQLRELIFIGAMLGLLAASYFLVFTKQDERRRAKTELLQQKQAALHEVDQENVSAQNVEQRMDDLKKAVAYFERKLPAATEMDQVLARIAELVDANGLRTSTVKFPKTERLGGYSELTMELSVAGNFDSFYVFTQQLEALPRLTRVSKMSLTKINEKDGDMEAAVTLIIYFDPNTEGGAAQPAGK